MAICVAFFSSSIILEVFVIVNILRSKETANSRNFIATISEQGILRPFFVPCFLLQLHPIRVGTHGNMQTQLLILNYISTMDCTGLLVFTVFSAVS